MDESIFFFNDTATTEIYTLSLHDALPIFARRIGRDHLEAGAMGIPACIALGMLGGDPGGRSIGAAKDDGAAHLTARHVMGFRRRVDDLVDRLHCEIEGHELDDWLEPGHGGADADSGEAGLGDRRVDHPARAEFLEQALADLIGALIFGDLDRKSVV